MKDIGKPSEVIGRIGFSEHLAARVPDGSCPLCTKELDGDGWCYECRVRRTKGDDIRCPRVTFECGHAAFIWPEEYGDGSAWCQTCGAFRCYDRCPRCLSFDCDHRESA